jgi:hypothetical protein
MSLSGRFLIKFPAISCPDADFLKNRIMNMSFAIVSAIDCDDFFVSFRVFLLINLKY